jgi:hypothetical protein
MPGFARCCLLNTLQQQPCMLSQRSTSLLRFMPITSRYRPAYLRCKLDIFAFVLFSGSSPLYFSAARLITDCKMLVFVSVAIAATLASGVVASGLIDHPIACDQVTYLDGQWDVSDGRPAHTHTHTHTPCTFLLSLERCCTRRWCHLRSHAVTASSKAPRAQHARLGERESADVWSCCMPCGPGPFLSLTARPYRTELCSDTTAAHGCATQCSGQACPLVGPLVGHATQG